MLRRFCPWLAALLVTAAACVGSIPNGDRPPEGPGADPAPPPAGACAAAAPWRTTTLTRAQYLHAAGDLLGIDVAPLLTLADVGSRTFTAGVTLTPLQVEQRMTTAEAIAAAATTPERLPHLLPCVPAADEAACADETIRRLGSRAFRRPLGSGDRRGPAPAVRHRQAGGGVRHRRRVADRRPAAGAGLPLSPVTAARGCPGRGGGGAGPAHAGQPPVVFPVELPARRRAAGRRRRPVAGPPGRARGPGAAAAGRPARRPGARRPPRDLAAARRASERSPARSASSPPS